MPACLLQLWMFEMSKSFPGMARKGGARIGRPEGCYLHILLVLVFPREDQCTKKREGTCEVLEGIEATGQWETEVESRRTTEWGMTVKEWLRLGIVVGWCLFSYGLTQHKMRASSRKNS
jgi:hypothetical protein